MDIKKGDRVLEIGSGGDPDWHSTILCDKFISDNSQRGEKGIFKGKPLIAADGELLPFKDKSFDYVICRHVLEHVDNPKHFLYICLGKFYLLSF